MSGVDRRTRGAEQLNATGMLRFGETLGARVVDCVGVTANTALMSLAEEGKLLVAVGAVVAVLRIIGIHSVSFTTFLAHLSV